MATASYDQDEYGDEFDQFEQLSPTHQQQDISVDEQIEEDVIDNISRPSSATHLSPQASSSHHIINTNTTPDAPPEPEPEVAVSPSQRFRQIQVPEFQFPEIDLNNAAAGNEPDRRSQARESKSSGGGVTSHGLSRGDIEARIQAQSIEEQIHHMLSPNEPTTHVEHPLQQERELSEEDLRQIDVEQLEKANERAEIEATMQAKMLEDHINYLLNQPPYKGPEQNDEPNAGGSRPRTSDSSSSSSFPVTAKRRQFPAGPVESPSPSSTVVNRTLMLDSPNSSDLVSVPDASPALTVKHEDHSHQQQQQQVLWQTKSVISPQTSLITHLHDGDQGADQPSAAAAQNINHRRSVLFNAVDVEAGDDYQAELISPSSTEGNSTTQSQTNKTIRPGQPVNEIEVDQPASAVIEKSRRKPDVSTASQFDVDADDEYKAETISQDNIASSQSRIGQRQPQSSSTLPDRTLPSIQSRTTTSTDAHSSHPSSKLPSTSKLRGQTAHDLNHSSSSAMVGGDDVQNERGTSEDRTHSPTASASSGQSTTQPDGSSSGKPPAIKLNSELHQPSTTPEEPPSPLQQLLAQNVNRANASEQRRSEHERQIDAQSKRVAEQQAAIDQKKPHRPHLNAQLPDSHFPPAPSKEVNLPRFIQGDRATPIWTASHVPPAVTDHNLSKAVANKNIPSLDYSGKSEQYERAATRFAAFLKKENSRLAESKRRQQEPSRFSSLDAHMRGSLPPYGSELLYQPLSHRSTNHIKRVTPLTKADIQSNLLPSRQRVGTYESPRPTTSNHPSLHKYQSSIARQQQQQLSDSAATASLHRPLSSSVRHQTPATILAAPVGTAISKLQQKTCLDQQRVMLLKLAARERDLAQQAIRETLIMQAHNEEVMRSYDGEIRAIESALERREAADRHRLIHGHVEPYAPETKEEDGGFFNVFDRERNVRKTLERMQREGVQMTQELEAQVLVRGADAELPPHEDQHFTDQQIPPMAMDLDQVYQSVPSNSYPIPASGPHAYDSLEEKYDGHEYEEGSIHPSSLGGDLWRQYPPAAAR